MGRTRPKVLSGRDLLPPGRQYKMTPRNRGKAFRIDGLSAVGADPESARVHPAERAVHFTHKTRSFGPGRQLQTHDPGCSEFGPDRRGQSAAGGALLPSNSACLFSKIVRNPLSSVFVTMYTLS